jgi:hypothetical protein
MPANSTSAEPENKRAIREAIRTTDFCTNLGDVLLSAANRPAFTRLSGRIWGASVVGLACDTASASDDAADQQQSLAPGGRLEAALAVYLAFDESAFTTGAIHIVDGGFTL